MKWIDWILNDATTSNVNKNSSALEDKLKNARHLASYCD